MTVMNSSNFQLSEQLESPRQHEEEANRLRCGLKAWCATTDERYELAESEDRDGAV
jgi:hypothetical protein